MAYFGVSNQINTPCGPPVCCSTRSHPWPQGFGEDDFQLGLPLYIPAHKKTRIDLVMKAYTVDATYPENASQQEKDQYYKTVADYVTNKMSNLNGFVIYDESSRTEIDLPNGWTEYSKKHSGSSKPDPPPPGVHH